ncbi:kelch-like protein 28, partial [Elysia marginata]
GNSALSDKWRKEYLPEYCVNSVEIFDPNDNTWSQGPSLSNALCGADGNSALSDKWRKEYLPEYCVNSVEIFDPNDKTWSQGPSLSNALCGAGTSHRHVNFWLRRGEHPSRNTQTAVTAALVISPF